MVDISKYWDDESRLVRPNPSLPTFCQHNILEVTGKILIAMAMGVIPKNERLIEVIKFSYSDFWRDIKFIPRTISKTFLPEMEPESADWEQHEFDYWYQTATSTTQLCYLLMGLQMCGEILAIDVMRQIVKDGWAIKCKGKIVTNGAFIPFGLVAIQRYAIGMVTGKEPGVLSRIMLSTVGTWSGFNKNYIWFGKLQNQGEHFSELIWLFWVARLGEPQHLKKFLPKYKDELLKWREAESANSDVGHYLGNYLSLAILKGIIDETK